MDTAEIVRWSLLVFSGLFCIMTVYLPAAVSAVRYDYYTHTVDSSRHGNLTCYVCDYETYTDLCHHLAYPNRLETKCLKGEKYCVTELEVTANTEKRKFVRRCAAECKLRGCETTSSEHPDGGVRTIERCQSCCTDNFCNTDVEFQVSAASPARPVTSSLASVVTLSLFTVIAVSLSR